MSDHRHILDAKGRKIALLDGQGNLSREAMMLYLADGLSTEDRAKVVALADCDPMTRDALDGLLKVPMNHTAAIGSMMAEMAERSGASVLPDSRPSAELPLLRIAAAMAALAVVITMGIMGQRWFSDRQEMADATPTAPKTDETPAEQVPEIGIASEAEDETEEVTSAEEAEAGPAPVVTEAPETSPTAIPVTTEKLTKAEDRKAETEVKAEALKAIAKKDNAQAENTGRAETLSVLDSERADANETASGAAARVSGSNRTEQELKPMSYDKVDTPARFPGGDLEMFRFIKLNRNYPEPVRNEGVKGSVLVRFTVNTQGRIENIQLVEGFNPVLDQDALRVLRAMPRWTPAEHEGQKVPVSRTVAVQYE